MLGKIKRIIHRATGPKSALPWRTRLEVKRLQELSRYVATTTRLLGPLVTIPDGPSFVSAWKDVFLNNIYKFPTKSHAPRILDCGANIGLGCVFFKTLFPRSRITAFEPDPKIFRYLQSTLNSVHLIDIELVPKAVWSSTTTLPFLSEGADAGRIATGPGPQTIEIGAVRLKDYLSEPIDFLKMDIEGAETAVLGDCADCLSNVRNLFVEYHSIIGRMQTIDKLLATLISAAFRVHIHSTFTSSNPFLSIDEILGMDLQLNIFAYRQRQ